MTDEAEAKRAAFIVDHTPSPIEVWLAGDGDRPDDESIKAALRMFGDLAGMGVEGTGALAYRLEQKTFENDEAWSLDPWVLGYQAGQATAYARAAQAAAHLANAIKKRMSP